MVLYVKSKEDIFWHWCKNCTKYSKDITNTTTELPVKELCPECYDKDKNRDCEGQNYTHPPGILFSD